MNFILFYADGQGGRIVYLADPRLGKETTPSKRLAKRYGFYEALELARSKGDKWYFVKT